MSIENVEIERATLVVPNQKVVSNPSKLKLDRNGNIDLTQYSDQDLSKYKSLSTSLSVKEQSSILNYGANVQQNMAKYSDNFLTQVRTFDSGEVGQEINNILTELNYIDIDKLEQNTLQKILLKIPILNKLVMSVKKIYQQF